MDDVKTFVGYHSTNDENAMNILSNNFMMPKVPDGEDVTGQERYAKYWLGAGIYFFEDVDVAKWWCTKPSSTFGCTGKHVIIESTLNSNKIWDLRKVSKWREIIKYFDYFMSLIGSAYVVNVPSENQKDLRQNLRCIFFTWLRSTYDIEMIIAAFNQHEFQYLEEGKYKIEDELDIYYTEVQYCVYDPNVIINNKVCKL